MTPHAPDAMLLQQCRPETLERETERVLEPRKTNLTWPGTSPGSELS